MSPAMVKLLKEKEFIEDKIQTFRNKCKHENKVSLNKGNTGNLDFNYYWIENLCNRCGKFWRSDEKIESAY
jgi:hypothetical protein